MTSLPRLMIWFVMTVLSGVLATLLAPLLTPAIHAQSAAVASAHGRAQSKPPVTWTRAVATRALVRGDTLRAEDFALRDTIVSRLPMMSDSSSPRAGWLIQRAFAPGEWLRAPGVSPAPAVTAGQPVVAFWSDGTVHLAVSAIALRSAPVGSAVSIRVGANRRLDGIVAAPDSVRLRQGFEK